MSWFRRTQPSEPWLDSGQVRHVLLEAIAEMPDGAVRLDEPNEWTYLLTPRAADAFSILVEDRGSGLFVFVADVGASIEIAAPLNVNNGKPNQPWDEDLREVITLVASGSALVGRSTSGNALCLVLDGSRMGVDGSLSTSAARLERGAIWS